MSNLQSILIKKRKELKLSLREAANLIGISHSYLSTLEKGIDSRSGSPVKPTPETLKLISKAYKIPYETLMQAAGYIDIGVNENKEMSKVDKFLLKLKKKAIERGIEFDENSVEDLLDLYEFIKSRDKKSN